MIGLFIFSISSTSSKSAFTDARPMLRSRVWEKTNLCACAPLGPGAKDKADSPGCLPGAARCFWLRASKTFAQGKTRKAQPVGFLRQ